jgi:hypothetical protein
MTVEVYRFTWEPNVSLNEAELTLHLAGYAVEGLFGQTRVRLDFSYFVDAPRRTIFIDGTTEVGAAIVKVFMGLAFREFGENAFQVCRVESNFQAQA